jgi:hypothetical protein
MKYLFKQNSIITQKLRGFVLPFTLLICGIMLLISVSISTILNKQIYFSNIARSSQAAYYAADNALACTLAIEEIYSDGATGFFPYDTSLNTTEEHRGSMQDKLYDLNSRILAAGGQPLASTINEIKCAQSLIFDTSPITSNFTVESENFVRKIEGEPDDEGKTSSFSMKMKIADNDYRCAKVTIHKTPTYKQVISQGYSRCDRPDGSIERAVVYTTSVE